MPIYLAKTPIPVSDLIIFIVGSIIFQLFSAWMILHSIYKSGGTVSLKSSERTAILFQSSTSMTGVINFKYAFGTKNTAII